MDFAELNQLLSDSAAEHRAAECHGFLCGYLAVRDNIPDNVLKDCLLNDINVAEMSLCLRELRQLAESVTKQINSEHFGLNLLLPEERVALPERGAALTEWCEGFLSGLGIAGMSDFDMLSCECREVVQDMVKICRLDIQDIQDASEEDESALTELVEYARMGAILLHDELHNPGKTNAGNHDKGRE